MISDPSSPSLSMHLAAVCVVQQVWDRHDRPEEGKTPTPRSAGENGIWEKAKPPATDEPSTAEQVLWIQLIAPQTTELPQS